LRGHRDLIATMGWVDRHRYVESVFVALAADTELTE
jgi:hypothetical protein